MNTLHITSFLQDLITDGIIAGVGSVLVFVQNCCVILFISLLEFRLYGKNSCING